MAKLNLNLYLKLKPVRIPFSVREVSMLVVAEIFRVIVWVGLISSVVIGGFAVSRLRALETLFGGYDEEGLKSLDAAVATEGKLAESRIAELAKAIQSTDCGLFEIDDCITQLGGYVTPIQEFMFDYLATIQDFTLVVVSCMLFLVSGFLGVAIVIMDNVKAMRHLHAQNAIATFGADESSGVNVSGIMDKASDASGRSGASKAKAKGQPARGAKGKKSSTSK